MRKKMKLVRRLRRKEVGKGKVFTGMLLGSVFGAAVALLMAPATGEELRRRITGEASNIREKIKASRGNVESKASELIHDVGTGAGVGY